MLLWRFLVRAKVFQFMGILAAAVFASVVLTTVRGGAVRRARGEAGREGECVYVCVCVCLAVVVGLFFTAPSEERTGTRSRMTAG